MKGPQAMLGLAGFTVLGHAEVGGKLELLIETTADLELMHLAALRRRFVTAFLDPPEHLLAPSWTRRGRPRRALTPAPPRSRVPASRPRAMCPAKNDRNQALFHGVRDPMRFQED